MLGMMQREAEGHGVLDVTDKLLCHPGPHISRLLQVRLNEMIFVPVSGFSLKCLLAAPLEEVVAKGEEKRRCNQGHLETL